SRIKSFGDRYRLSTMTKEDGSFFLEINEEFEYEFAASNNSSENQGFSGWLSFSKDELNNSIKLILKPVK
nr:hypothetical protein [Pyrinomonadaceae bacterium]